MKSEKLNLLFILNCLGIGGAEKHTICLLNALDPAKFKVSLAYLKDEEEAKEPDLLRTLIDSNQIEGRIFCCEVKKKFDLKAVRTLTSHINEDKIDVIVCANTYPLLYGWLAGKLAKKEVRLVEIFHTTFLDSLKAELYFLLYRAFFFSCDMLVFVCQTQREYWLSRKLRARSDRVIYNGIDTNYFTDRFSLVEKMEV